MAKFFCGCARGYVLLVVRGGAKLLRTLGSRLGGASVHLIIQIPGRKEYVAFIRSLTGLVARKLGKGLWKLLPFTRIANWGRDFRNLVNYLRKNLEEWLGFRVYEPRKDYYQKYRAKPK